MDKLKVNLPLNVVVFKYKEIPHEWHVVGLPANAFGCGASVPTAFNQMFKTLQGQFEELGEHGFAAVFGVGADPEWAETFRTGKHPTDETIVVTFRGSLTICFQLAGNRVRVEPVTDVKLSTSSTGELQPA